MEILDLAGHLIRRLHQNATHAFQTRIREAGLDMTPVQFAAMNTLSAAPGIDQATIAARIACDRATTGGVIDRLVQKGWVARSVSAADRRAREVALTDEGAAALAAALPVVLDLQSDILPGLSEAERATFLALARKAAPMEGGSG